MCGIAGWAAAAEAAPAMARLAEMTRRLAHRGPDGEGELHQATADGAFRIGLGHRRLAIIDPRGGHQPMIDAAGEIAVAFNGEIYNFRQLRDELAALGHQFRTASDTEVLLHGWRQWQSDLVGRLRGMFAFALWDRRSETLLLARDRFGKKPLFLHRGPGRLLFASEIKALLAIPGVPPDIDLQAVSTYLLYRYVPGPATLYRDVVKLPPGSFALWRRGELEVQGYHTGPDAAPPPDEALPDDPVAAFQAEFDQAVALRMISDVPFGAFLSGGLDSSAVVAAMSRQSSLPVATFSVGFADPRLSELSYAATIAKAFATRHHELTVAPDDIIDQLPRLIGFRDAPVAEPSDIAIFLLSQAAARDVKMVLTGEGADEVLGGYPKHLFERHVGAWQAMVPQPVHQRLLLPLAQALPWRFHRAKTLAACFGIRDSRERLPRWFGALDRAGRRRLSALPEPMAEAGGDSPFLVRPGTSALRRMLHFDQASWLPDNLLERGDRMTMAASIEARMPFLDHRLAAFVSSLPDRFRCRGNTTKWLLRQAMARQLPKTILERPKIGFRVPVADWFRTSLRGFLRDHLDGPGSLTRDYYHPAALRGVLDEHERGRHNHEKLLWTLLTLELFHRHAASVAAPAADA